MHSDHSVPAVEVDESVRHHGHMWILDFEKGEKPHW